MPIRSVNPPQNPHRPPHRTLLSLSPSLSLKTLLNYSRPHSHTAPCLLSEQVETWRLILGFQTPAAVIRKHNGVSEATPLHNRVLPPRPNPSDAFSKDRAHALHSPLSPLPPVSPLLHGITSSPFPLSLSLHTHTMFWLLFSLRTRSGNFLLSFFLSLFFSERIQFCDCANFLSRIVENHIR